MPASKRPRKAYRPAVARTSANHNQAFRFNAGADLYLQMAPHQALEALHTGAASSDDHNTLAIRVFWAAQIARDHFESDEHIAVLDLGVRAVAAISDRYDRIGRFGATGPELLALGDALVIADQMQKLATRRELEASFAKVLAGTKFKLKEMQKNIL